LRPALENKRWIIRVDHLSDDDLAFYGWIRVAEDEEFGLYVRPHDGERQVVSNDPPRWFVVEDYNDAVYMSDGRIITAPDAED
jgi:hypothetical protein